MLEWKLKTDDSWCTIYEKGTRECMLNATFDKENKTVDVCLYEWVSNGTPRLEPMSEWIKYSAKYGHTQRTCPTLSMEDIEFLYKKSKEILGGGCRIVAKIRMPKTRAEFEKILITTFEAGCNHGYGVKHTQNVSEQERLGAEHWLGRISDEEFYNRWDKLKGY